MKLTKEQKELLQEVCLIINEVGDYNIGLSMYNENGFLEKDGNEYDLGSLAEDMNIVFGLECDI